MTEYQKSNLVVGGFVAFLVLLSVGVGWGLYNTNKKEEAHKEKWVAEVENGAERITIYGDNGVIFRIFEGKFRYTLQGGVAVFKTTKGNIYVSGNYVIEPNKGE